MPELSEDFSDPLHLLKRIDAVITPPPAATPHSTSPDSTDPDSWEAAAANIAAAQAGGMTIFPPEILAYRRVAHGSLDGEVYYIVDVAA